MPRLRTESGHLPYLVAFRCRSVQPPHEPQESLHRANRRLSESAIRDRPETDRTRLRPASVVEIDFRRMGSGTRDRDELHRRALTLEYATIGWNIGEAVLTVSLGAVAASLALIGFGTVSVIEVFASSVVVWHLLPGHEGNSSGRTRRALRLTAGAFGALAVVLAVLAIRDLATGRVASESPWGIAYLAVTAFVMFALASKKRRTAESLGSAPLQSEAQMTFLDGVLSTATLVGLGLNAYAGWWWADPLAALLVAIAAANEARVNWLEADDFAPDSE